MGLALPTRGETGRDLEIRHSRLRDRGEQIPECRHCRPASSLGGRAGVGGWPGQRPDALQLYCDSPRRVHDHDTSDVRRVQEARPWAGERER